VRVTLHVPERLDKKRKKLFEEMLALESEEEGVPPP
jgi:hypothetical protein